MQKLIDKLFEKGKEKGFEEQEVYYSNSIETSVVISGGELEKFSNSSSGGMSYRAIIDGKLGYAFTELMEDSSIPMLIEEVYSNAKAVESEDKVFLYGEKAEYANVNTYNDIIKKVPLEEKIEILKKIEDKAKSLDSRIVEVSNNTYAENETEIYIKNTKGLDLHNKSNIAYCYFGLIIKDGEKMNNHYEGKIIDDFSALDIDTLVKEAVDEASRKLTANPIASRTCDIVFDKVAFSSLFDAFLSYYNAELVQKQISPLENKIGELIAIEDLTVVDDPHMKNGVASAPFDAEGYPTRSKRIVDSGKLITYLHNLKTADKDGVESTGNASRGSYKGAVDISPSNVVISAGKMSKEEILKKCNEGIYITSLSGLHAGINFASGDFSLQAEGIVIEGGALTKSVNQIVLSGNYLQLLKNIKQIGNDVENSVFSPNIYMPTIMVGGLTVSGE